MTVYGRLKDVEQLSNFKGARCALALRDIIDGAKQLHVEQN
jgi:hypothetical protein